MRLHRLFEHEWQAVIYKRTTSKASSSMIETIVNDLVSQRFDEAGDIIRFVQNRLGKADSQKASAFWAGRGHMISDRQTLKAYVKSEVES